MPLMGATILLLDSDPLLGTTADSNGRFRLEGVPVGRRSLQITFLGYEPYIMRDVLVQSGKETVVQIALVESIMELGEVDVTPRTNKAEALHPMAILSARQLSVEEASRYAGGFDDPARLASSFAGVASELTSNGIAIRGNAPTGLLWRFEGVEIASPSHFTDLQTLGGGGISALSSHMLADSDFFTGAFPAEYGNALSGVFDVKLRTGNPDQREYTLQAGAIGLDAAAEGPIGLTNGDAYLFNYRYATLNLIAHLLPEDAAGTRYQDLSFKTSFPTQKAGTFSLWGLGSTDTSGQQEETDAAQRVYDQDRESAESKTRMGAVGLRHQMVLGAKTFWTSMVAASGNGVTWAVDRLNDDEVLRPQSFIRHNNWTYTISTHLDHKFNARYSHTAGITLNRRVYDLDLQEAQGGMPIAPVAVAKGSSMHLQVYTQTQFRLSPTWTMNGGVHGQCFALSGETVIEPRIGVQWTVRPNQTLGVAYGKHSQLARLAVYFAEGGVNKDLRFTKAHHLVFSYDRQLGPQARLKIEPFYQRLYDVPVAAGSSFSLLNLSDDWFIDETLNNEGTGSNLGVDLTLERFLDRGYYAMLTASLFNAKYTGGDGVERDSRYNKRFVVNLLGGKEWALGNRNLFSINGRVHVQGGDRISPVDHAASLQARDVVFDETQAFTMQKPGTVYAHLTLNYRRNRDRHTSTWSLQVLNLLATKTVYGYGYNYLDGTIDRIEEILVIPNLSYKIEW